MLDSIFAGLPADKRQQIMMRIPVRKRGLGIGNTADGAACAPEAESCRAIADLRCSGPVTSELGPDWFEKLGVEAVEEAEFLIPGA